MQRRKCNTMAVGLVLLCLLVPTACGARRNATSSESGTVQPPVEDTYNMFSSDDTLSPEEAVAEPTAFVPTEDQVVALREQVEAGMTQDEIDALVEFFIPYHARFNRALASYDLFVDLLDPYGYKWNYFDQTGEIRIGTNVISSNEHDAYWFADQLAELKASVKSGLLDEDFDRMIALCISAADHHRAEDAKELFHMIHDLDFYLLRYGPVNALGARDMSALKTYYGSLSIWSEEARADRAQGELPPTPSAEDSGLIKG